VGTKSKYQVKVINVVKEKDLPELPLKLRQDFQDICNSIFVEDPYGCFGLDSHNLKGDLSGYRALEIDWNGISYRLVYRIYEKPVPKRVLIVSFAEHDPAYEKAKQRKS
jgi:Txe/YoeB family toxin of Txe-Axe toxin-antitoxin module